MKNNAARPTERERDMYERRQERLRRQAPLNYALEHEAAHGLDPEHIDHEVRDVTRGGVVVASNVKFEMLDVGKTMRNEETRADVLAVLPAGADGSRQRFEGHGLSEKGVSGGSVREKFSHEARSAGWDPDRLLEWAQRGTRAEKREGQQAAGLIVTTLANHSGMDDIAVALKVPVRSLYRWRKVAENST